MSCRATIGNILLQSLSRVQDEKVNSKPYPKLPNFYISSNKNQSLKNTLNFMLNFNTLINSMLVSRMNRECHNFTSSSSIPLLLIETTASEKNFISECHNYIYSYLVNLLRHYYYISPSWTKQLKSQILYHKPVIMTVFQKFSLGM